MLSFSNPATVAVEKATSDLIISPDWTLNMEICDNVNSSHWQVKDVIKAVKKRLQHKESTVQQLALTLLETLVNNCGDSVHQQIVEKNILREMIKIVKKKADIQVRDKILGMLDSWRQTFGGQEGKYPEYYLAYLELRRSFADFPSQTPPVSHPMLGGTSTTVEKPMATDVEGLSLSSLESMRDVMDLLRDMLEAVDPSDPTAVKDEVIVDLIDRCRSNQKNLMQMLISSRDDEILDRGLILNDSLQDLLAKHDAIASGSPILAIVPVDEEYEEEEDEFAQLARRHSKSPTSATTSNALTLVDPLPPVNTTTEEDMIDLFSNTLSTALVPASPTVSDQNTHIYQQDLPQFDNYVASWAQPHQYAQTQQDYSQLQPPDFQMQPPSRSQNPFDYPSPPWGSESTDAYYTSHDNETISYAETSTLAGDPQVTSSASNPFATP